MKTKVIIAVIAIVNLLAIGCAIFCGKESPQPQTEQVQQETKAETSQGLIGDGLRAPDTAVKNQLNDIESGLADVEEFSKDINGDGVVDKITRIRIETGTAHGYDKYKIELRVGADFVDITPEGFRTVEGADCMLKKLRFRFSPEFSVTMISRPWRDSWITPTMATKTEYRVINGRMEIVSTQNLREICDVEELF